MNIAIREWSKEVIELFIDGAPLPLLNVIRRYSLAKVPTYAIDEVTVVSNTSAMFDEMLAHRLAMIPIRSEESVDRLLEVDIDTCKKCSLDSDERPSKDLCDKCFVNMFLEIEAHDNEVTVYSGDIKSEDPYVKPVYDNIPIVVLAPGQRVALEIRARIGRGLEHAKWSPATVSVTRHLARIEVDKSLCNLCGKCVEVCPKKVLYMNGNEIRIRNIFDCIICRQCVQVCQSKAISVDGIDDKNILRIESSGSLEPETILKISLEILKRELMEIRSFIEELKKGGGS
ncbi:MAG: DNA-directed RNA polymerase subunit D [Ignisphaera sp.]